jgi:hypothetical protein
LTTGRAGVAALRRVLAAIDSEPPMTGNELEREFLFFAAEEHLPRPVDRRIAASIAPWS